MFIHRHTFVPGNEWGRHTTRRKVHRPPACEFACTALVETRGPRELPPGHGPPAPTLVQWCGTLRHHNHETPSWTAGLNWMDNPRSRGLKFLPPPNLQAGGGSPRVTPRGLSELCLRQAHPSTSGYLYPAARTRRCPRHQRGDPAPLVKAAAP